MKKAQADGMSAVALTDHGNMFGAFNFVAEANSELLVLYYLDNLGQPDML